MEKRLLVLGAGRHQKELIRRAEQRGLRVVASDYYPDAPGKAFASYSANIDALAIEDNIRLAKKYRVCGVITSGTDQPLVTMAEVAASLGLPCYLTPESARTATNKSRMASAFSQHGVQRAPWREVRSWAEAEHAAATFGFPLVVKPTDAQGQRGISRVSSRESLETAFGGAIRASRGACAIIEPFVGGWEVTANAWVKDGDVHLQMITDRVTYNPLPAIGICFQHIYPSLRAKGMEERIRDELRRIARCYGVTDAPLYVQMIVHRDGLSVVEAACRIGGGHESSLARVAFGVDMLDRLIDLALEGRAGPIQETHDNSGAGGHALVNFLLARPGTVTALDGFDASLARGLIAEGGYYISSGHRCRPIIDGQGRVGYFVVKEASRAGLLDAAAAVYAGLAARDANGRNLLFVPDQAELLA